LLYFLLPHGAIFLFPKRKVSKKKKAARLMPRQIIGLLAKIHRTTSSIEGDEFFNAHKSQFVAWHFVSAGIYFKNKKIPRRAGLFYKLPTTN